MKLEEKETAMVLSQKNGNQKLVVILMMGS